MDNTLNIDGEDFDDYLVKLETSFGIKFDRDDFVEVMTYGQLEEKIISKLPQNFVHDCTHQQVFYKLRKTIIKTCPDNIVIILPSTLINEIFERSSVKEVQKIEEMVNYKTDIVGFKRWYSAVLWAVGIASFVFVFITLFVGIAGLVMVVLLNLIKNNFTSTVKNKTVGDWAKRVAIYNYKKSRRNPDTINIVEAKAIIKSVFCDMLVFDKEEFDESTKLFGN